MPTAPPDLLRRSDVARSARATHSGDQARLVHWRTRRRDRSREPQVPDGPNVACLSIVMSPLLLAINKPVGSGFGVRRFEGDRNKLTDVIFPFFEEDDEGTHVRFASAPSNLRTFEPQSPAPQYDGLM